MTTNYNDVRNNLLAMLEELDDRLTTITHHVRHADNDIEKDSEEQNEGNDVEDYLGNSARREIKAIKEALARIDRGDYHICQTCGEEINPERLKVIPYSNVCIKCAQQVEQ